jgi:hypothetical protein
MASDIAMMVGRATEWLGRVRGALPAAGSGPAY